MELVCMVKFCRYKFCCLQETELENEKDNSVFQVLAMLITIPLCVSAETADETEAEFVLLLKKQFPQREASLH